MATVIGRRIALGAAALASGCAVDAVSPQDPLAAIPDRSAEIRVGQAERRDVRRALGTPLFSSYYWGFDLFRADAEQTATAVAIVPAPIPFARMADRLHRYTLVAYDAADRASALASGVARRPPSWRNVAPIVSDYPAVHLRAAEVMFYVDPEGARDVNLLATPIRRDAFLRLGWTSAGCTVVIGCGARECADQLSVDAGPARRLAVRSAHAYWLEAGERAGWLREGDAPGSDRKSPWLETLVAIRLGSGRHALEFSSRHLGGRGAVNIACRQGEVAYLVVDATDNGSVLGRALSDWRFERSDAMPERFAGRPLVLVDDGQWQVDAEPDR